MNRKQALHAALADLPPPGSKAVSWTPMRQAEDGSVVLPYTDYHAGIDKLFKRFNAGEFCLACDDRNYQRGLDRFGTLDTLVREGAAGIARMYEEECLLLLRFFDRQERFCDGAGLRP